MEICGSCKYYVYNKVSGPSCSKNGKAVSYLMQKDCFVPLTAEDMADVPTKVCNRCHRSLPITAFSRKSSTKDGYQFQCKECQGEMARELYGKRKAVQEKDKDKMPETKVCRQCGRELPVSMFGKAPKNQYGLKSYCHDCENENCRKYRARIKAERPKTAPAPEEEIVNDLTDAPALPFLTLEQAIDFILSKGYTVTIQKVATI